MTETRPTGVVGGPVRDREWAVPAWLGGLCGLDYPRDLLRLAVLVNDSADETHAACRWWAERALSVGFAEAMVSRHDTGCPVDNNARKPDRDYRAFAQARDAWVAMRGECEWLLQVDSDIQVPAGLLRELVDLAQGHGLAMLAAVIDNSHIPAAAFFHSNVLNRDERGQLWHVEDALEDRSAGVKPCDLTGACVLLHRSVFDTGLRYDVPEVVELGEDAPFCAAVIAAGWQPHYAPRVRATHWSKAPEDTTHLSNRTWHLGQAYYHLWRAFHARGAANGKA